MKGHSYKEGTAYLKENIEEYLINASCMPRLYAIRSYHMWKNHAGRNFFQLLYVPRNSQRTTYNYIETELEK